VGRSYRRWLARNWCVDSGSMEAQQAGQRRRANEHASDGEGVLRPSGGSGFDRGYSDYKIGAAQRRIDTISSMKEAG
jgi:hypothetical protein